MRLTLWWGNLEGFENGFGWEDLGWMEFGKRNYCERVFVYWGFLGSFFYFFRILD